MLAERIHRAQMGRGFFGTYVFNMTGADEVYCDDIIILGDAGAQPFDFIAQDNHYLDEFLQEMTIRPAENQQIHFQLDWDAIKLELPDQGSDLSVEVFESIFSFNNAGYNLTVDLILYDHSQNIENLDPIIERFLNLPVVYFSDEIKENIQAMKHGAYDFLEKPFNMGTLELSLAKIIKQQEILEENIRLKGQIQQQVQGMDQIVGAHPRMQKVYEQIITAADIELTVLIMGETGTGKELVADALHAESQRRDMPLVKVDCTAIPENLL